MNEDKARVVQHSISNFLEASPTPPALGKRGERGWNASPSQAQSPSVTSPPAKKRRAPCAPNFQASPSKSPVHRPAAQTINKALQSTSPKLSPPKPTPPVRRIADSIPRPVPAPSPPAATASSQLTPAQLRQIEANRLRALHIREEKRRQREANRTTPPHKPIPLPQPVRIADQGARLTDQLRTTPPSQGPSPATSYPAPRSQPKPLKQTTITASLTRRDTSTSPPSHQPTPTPTPRVQATTPTPRSATTPRSRASSVKSPPPMRRSGDGSGWQPLQANQRETTVVGDTLESCIVSPNVGRSGPKAGQRDKYYWLTEPRDSQKRIPSDPDYDPSTLFIPRTELTQLTENQQIYWEFKKDHFDTIVFYQGGSFYELYGNDAILGAKVMDLKLTMRSGIPMVGFPTWSYEKWAAKFVALGHKVARMDQYVDPTTGKLTKRVLGDYLTRGTLVDSPLLNDGYNYLLALYENQETHQMGVCVVECSLGQLAVGQLDDDSHRTQLKTLLLQLKPAEIVYLQGNLSRETLHWCRQFHAPVLSAVSVDKRNVWTSSFLADYFDDFFPQLAQHPVYESSSAMARSAWAGCLHYLSGLQERDRALMQQGNIQSYSLLHGDHALMLDGETLLNLEILENNQDHSSKRTLGSVMMHCHSPFGKRLFMQWLCSPLQRITAIEERLDAVEELMAQGDVTRTLSQNMTRLPDMERLLSRIHAKSVPLKGLLQFIQGLEELVLLVESYGCPPVQEGGDMELSPREPYVFQSSYLSRLTRGPQEGGEFPAIHEVVAHFSDGVDRVTSQEKDILTPRRGYSPSYDSAVEQVEQWQATITQHLESLKEETGIAQLKYKDTTQMKYQIEVSHKHLQGKKMPAHLVLVKSLKTVARYRDPTIEEAITNLTRAEEELTVVASNQLSQTIEQLDEHYRAFQQAIACVAQLDCLVSLVHASNASGMHSRCRPQFVDPSESDGSFLHVEELVHPFLELGPDSEVIPNDIFLGGEHPRATILTGPNMGGKSTLLRQACLAIIMAQVGCYVPAVSCRMTPFDRIFTRIGADDNIFEGQSTFMVELQETAQILHQATPRSFVILDELGRGTSTFDGTAIAHSVLHHLLYTRQPLLIFATHYHLLVDDWKESPLLSLYHMACFEDMEEQVVTFLYKAVPGACPNSRGMNVARMAQVPESIVAQAERVSRHFEISFGTRKNILAARIVRMMNQKGTSPAAELLDIWTALHTQYSR